MGTSKIIIDGVGIDLTSDTVAANKMLSGIKAHDSNGDSVTGSIPSKAAQTYTPGTTDQTIAAGQYLSGAQTIKGDVNLIADNIKDGVEIFGKVGTLKAKQTVTWHQCPEAVKLFLDEIEYDGYLAILWQPSFQAGSGTISYSSDNPNVFVSAFDTSRAKVIGGEITRGTTVVRATITAVKNGVSKTLKVRLDNNPEYSNSTVMSCIGETYAPTYAVTGNSKPIGKIVDGVTYYNEVPNVETPFSSENVAGTLEPLDSLRWLNTQLTTGPYHLLGNNVRDSGGWNCDGGTIKYGMLVRGGEINPADKNLMVSEVGIRTEVSLLPISRQQYTESPWDIDYVANPTNTDFMYRTDISTADIKTQWKLYLNTILNSVKHSKPVIFHCGVGADKTGTMACVLLGILGVSLSDIQKDFELTSFAPNSDVGGLAAIRDRYVYLPFLLDRLSIYPLKTGLADTFQNHCISFALDCETTVRQINDFRNACIDGTPTPIVIGHFVTNNLTQCINSNPATSVTDGESYSAAITANSGYEIQSISVSMGGVDITSTAVSGNNINIANVTGDIIVTAVAESAGTNLFPSHFFDVDGHTLYNGQGYKSGERFSKSGGTVVSASALACMTGYLSVAGGQKITISGAHRNESVAEGYMSIVCFDENHAVIGSPSSGYPPKGSDAASSADGTYTLPSNASYVRIGCDTSACASGGTLVVTLNQDATNVLDIYGYQNGKRISLSSTNPDKIVSAAGQTATGQIPVAAGDIVRFKDFKGGSETYAITAYFDENRNYKAGYNSVSEYVGKVYTLTVDGVNIATITYNPETITTMEFTNNANGYISLSGYCTNNDGANAFVTKNEPLPS